jgi:hypothetical protein
MNSKQDNRVKNIWWIVAVLLGALLTSQCNNQSNPPVAGVSPPVVSDLSTDRTSNELLPGEEVEIWVNVAVADRNTPIIYTWSIEGGKIIKGQGTESITYKVPDVPGEHRVSVKVEYGDWDTEKFTSLVVLMPTPTNTPTSTAIPTATLTASPTDTPTPPPPPPLPPSTATFTPVPPTPTPEAVVVAANGLNLRSGPGVVYDPPIGYLRNGDILDIKGRIASNEWVQVIPVSGTNIVSGWVSTSPKYVQINVDLGGIPVVKVPPTPTATPSPPPPIPVITASPTLLEPLDKAGSYRNRLDLSWDWPGTLGPNDYFQVEIRNRYNVFFKFDESVPPIDVAWVKDKFYHYYVVNEAYDREYKWRIIVVRGTPPKEKQWSTLENQVWEPSAQAEWISEPSEMRTLYVEPGPEPPPATGEPGPIH